MAALFLCSRKQSIISRCFLCNCENQVSHANMIFPQISFPVNIRPEKDFVVNSKMSFEAFSLKLKFCVVTKHTVLNRGPSCIKVLS